MAENDLHDLRDVYASAFPRLDAAQLEALAHCVGVSRQQYRNGQKLIEIGDRDFKFFVIKSGEIEILDEAGEMPRTIAILGPGEFTGEVAHLTGGPSLVSAIARGDCDVYEVSAEGVRQIINRFPDDRIRLSIVEAGTYVPPPPMDADKGGPSPSPALPWGASWAIGGGSARGGTPTLASRTRHRAARSWTPGAVGGGVAIGGGHGAGGGPATSGAVGCARTSPGTRSRPRRGRGVCAAARRWRARSQGALWRGSACRVSIRATAADGSPRTAGDGTRRAGGVGGERSRGLPPSRLSETATRKLSRLTRRRSVFLLSFHSFDWSRIFLCV